MHNSSCSYVYVPPRAGKAIRSGLFFKFMLLACESRKVSAPRAETIRRRARGGGGVLAGRAGHWVAVGRARKLPRQPRQ
eukprot:11191827-Lingulodinium_polyedra.AAC.1